MTVGNYSNLYSLMGSGSTTGFFGSSCVYNPFSNASVGWAIGTSIFQTVVQSISSSSSSKQESDPEKCVQKLDKQISEIVTKLGAEDEDSALRIEPDKKYQDNIDKANSNISTYTAAIKTYDENIAAQENIIKAYDSTQQTIAEGDEPTQLTGELDKDFQARKKAYTDAKALQKAADQATKEKATLVTEKAKEEKNLENAKAKLETAQKAQKAEQAKIDKLQNSLKDLIAQRNGYKAQIDSKLLSKADGTKLSRTSDKKMTAKYNMDYEKGEVTFNDPDNNKVERGDLENLLLRFQKADGKQKLSIAKMFDKLWRQTENDLGQRSGTLSKAYKTIIAPYIEKYSVN